MRGLHVHRGTKLNKRVSGKQYAVKHTFLELVGNTAFFLLLIKHQWANSHELYEACIPRVKFCFKWFKAKFSATAKLFLKT